MKTLLCLMALLTAVWGSTAAAADGDLDDSFGGGIPRAPVTTDHGFPAIAAVRSDGRTTLCSVEFPSWHLFLSRFEASGRLDASFGDGGVVDTGIVIDGLDFQLDMAAKLDNLIVVAVYKASSHNLFLLQFDQSGALDTSFGNNGTVLINVPTQQEAGFDLAVSDQGWLVVAGINTTLHAPFLAKITTNGQMDTGFGVGGVVYAGFSAGFDTDVCVDISFDDIFMGCRDVATGRPYVVRFNWLGYLIPAFGNDGISIVDVYSGYDAPIDLKIDSTSHIYLAGDYSSYGEFFVARLGAEGALDAGFGDGGIVRTGIESVAGTLALGTQDGGKVVVASTESGTNNFYLCRFDTQGQPDEDFGLAGVTRLGIDHLDASVTMTVCPDDKILLASQNLDLGISAAFVARFTADGWLDIAGLLPGRAYSSIANYSSKVAMTPLPGGGMLLAGITSQGSYYMQRFDSTGLRDPNFWLGGCRILPDIMPGSLSPVDIANIPGTTDFYLLGHNGYSGFMGRLFVQRFHGDGSEDTAFAGGFPVWIDMEVDFEKDASIVAFPDGRVRLAGVKSSLGEHFLVGIRANGTLDESFGDDGYMITDVHSGMANGVELAAMANENLVLAGYDVNTQQTFLMRFDNDGYPVLNFGIGGVARSGVVYASNRSDVGLALSDSGPLLSGINGSVQYYVARFTWNGVLDPTYGVGGIASAEVYTFDYMPNAIAVQSDGKVVLVGAKMSTQNNFFVRLGTDGARDTEFGLFGGVNTDLRSALHSGVCLGIQEDGKILAAGHDMNQGQDYLVRLIATPESVTAVPEDSVPTKLSLNQNFPNPFNPSTTISFSLPQPANASLYIYDVSGRLVRTPVAGAALQSGRHEVVWRGDDNLGRTVAGGVYFYRLEAGNFSETKRMVLIK